MAKASLPRGARIGVLGDGQLGKMLAEAAWRLGIECHLHGDPVDIKREKSLVRFLSKVDTVIFENEFVDCALLAKLCGKLSHRFQPRLAAIRTLQDKIEQKKLLARLAIPSAPFVKIKSCRSSADLAGQLKKLPEVWHSGFVLKWSRNGYDGNGVCFADLTHNGIAKAWESCTRAWAGKISVFAEQKVQFVRELAIIAVRGGIRSAAQEFKTYPLVISIQEQGICKKVMGPAVSLGVPQALEISAVAAAEKIAVATKWVGSFAIEFFETQDGLLWVNEIAPRVHNSGHFTQDASETDQFENHIRATMGLPLGQTSTTAVFAMINLLGPEQVQKKWMSPPVPGSRGHVHWYHKAESRPRRKMGHINAIGTSVDQLPELLEDLVKCEQNWVDRISLTDGI